MADPTGPSSSTSCPAPAAAWPLSSPNSRSPGLLSCGCWHVKTSPCPSVQGAVIPSTASPQVGEPIYEGVTVWSALQSGTLLPSPAYSNEPAAWTPRAASGRQSAWSS